MKIKINNNTHKIKPASSLTVWEYISLMSGLDGKTGVYDQLVKFIAVTTEVETLSVMKTNIDHRSISRLAAYIGQIHLPTDMPELKSFYYKRKGRTLHQSSLNWQTVGARKMLEESNLKNSLEQSVYLLACYLAEYDAEKADNIYNELQNYNSLEVFGFILFFFKKL